MNFVVFFSDIIVCLLLAGGMDYGGRELLGRHPSRLTTWCMRLCALLLLFMQWYILRQQNSDFVAMIGLVVTFGLSIPVVAMICSLAGKGKRKRVRK
ncbi:MAG: hypothetical protein SOI54_08535 [Acetobacter sp.]|jgi:hypothetical protein